MAAYDATTNALTTESTASGVARTAATVTNPTTTVTGDTNQAYKSFSVGATVSLYGCGLFSASSSGDMWQWHRWAAVVNFQSGDTLQETMQLQCKLGS
jgi:hypothetical protein